MFDKHVPYSNKYGDLKERLKTYVRFPPSGLTKKETLLFHAVRNRKTGCWDWLGDMNQKGYGRLFYNGKKHSAHRVSFEMFNGPISEDLEIDHVCENRKCVNPAHLQQITHRQNIRNGRLMKSRRIPKTHCPQGHPYQGDNVLWTRGGYQYCRQCRRDYDKRIYWEKKDA